jgi:hypothetical protein
MTKLNPEGLIGLAEWEILDDILHYDCIKQIEFSSYMTIRDIVLLYEKIQ